MAPTTWRCSGKPALAAGQRHLPGRSPAWRAALTRRAGAGKGPAPAQLASGATGEGAHRRRTARTHPAAAVVTTERSGRFAVHEVGDVLSDVAEDVVALVGGELSVCDRSVELRRGGVDE